MKIVVIGGTGLIGSKLVHLLGRAGHEVVAASPDTGVDTLTGHGLAEVLTGARVVVDVSNSPSFADADVLDFFRTSTGNLLAAEKVAGVAHHVALSVVGADRLPDSGYLRAKVAQEALIEQGGVPWTILRATQFFEFLRAIAASATDGDTIRLTPRLFQPVAADEVASTLAELATGTPSGAVAELGGPETFPMATLVERYLAAAGGDEPARKVIADPATGYFGAVLDDTSLVTGPGARIGAIGFPDWLAAR
ncbi:SDR family oxidoreductase [Actinoplanes sp. NPDC051494]|uniref:SDR family oxidoreductase n=1 Tax=Actinoplanes sp. NPDC051494 TaxID=3363907 RepID=UPI00379BD029